MQSVLKSKSNKVSGWVSNNTRNILESLNHPGRVEPLNLMKAVSTVFVGYIGVILVTIVVQLVSIMYFYRVKISTRLFLKGANFV